MSSPIQNRIGAVFVPVSDMQRAVAWYSALFGLPVGDTSHQGKIYDLEMACETRLILDGNQPVHSSSQPLCFFWTDDIQEARSFLLANFVTIVRDVEDIGSLSTLAFKDPDGNLLMVCQRNE